MMKIEISESGFVHSIAEFGGWKKEKHGDDFCAWARRFTLGALVLLFLVAFILAILAGLGVASLNAIFKIEHYTWFQMIFWALPSGILSFILVCLGIAAIGGLMKIIAEAPVWIIRKFQQWRRVHSDSTENTAPTPPSAFSMWYQSVRGRVCAKLTLTK